MYFGQQDKRLVKNLKSKFGEDSVLILGDWSAPTVKYHEPIRNKGMIRMLMKNGFGVYLINEFKTSSVCPDCEGALKNSVLLPIQDHTEEKKIQLLPAMVS